MYLLGTYIHKMLAQINAHPRDSKIRFQDEGHIYFIEGMEGHPISVTTLIHKFFPDFNSDKVIAHMMKSKNWEQSPYFGMTKEEIQQQWKENGEKASALGTAMHNAIEDYINDEAAGKVSCGKELQLAESKLPIFPPVPTQTIEFGYFLRFWKELKVGTADFKAYRTEWLVFDEEKRLAGSIDLVLSNSKGDIIICDWKRSKEIKFNNKYQKGLKVLSHLEDCNYEHYCLQLNIYRHLLETKYGKKVVGMFLVIFHPNQSQHQLINVPKRQKEIDDIWDLLPMEK